MSDWQQELQTVDEAAAAAPLTRLGHFRVQQAVSKLVAMLGGVVPQKGVIPPNEIELETRPVEPKETR